MLSIIFSNNQSHSHKNANSNQTHSNTKKIQHSQPQFELESVSDSQPDSVPETKPFEQFKASNKKKNKSKNVFKGLKKWAEAEEVVLTCAWVSISNIMLRGTTKPL